MLPRVGVLYKWTKEGQRINRGLGQLKEIFDMFLEYHRVWKGFICATAESVIYIR